MTIYIATALLMLQALIVVMMYRNRYVVSVVRERAIESWSNYAVHLTSLGIESDSRFAEAYRSLPSYNRMLFSLGKWSYDSLTGNYERRLLQIYQEALNERTTVA
jgi:hypothetical protein